MLFGKVVLVLIGQNQLERGYNDDLNGNYTADWLSCRGVGNVCWKGGSQ